MKISPCSPPKIRILILGKARRQGIKKREVKKEKKNERGKKKEKKTRERERKEKKKRKKKDGKKKKNLSHLTPKSKPNPDHHSSPTVTFINIII